MASYFLFVREHVVLPSLKAIYFPYDCDDGAREQRCRETDK